MSARNQFGIILGVLLVLSGAYYVFFTPHSSDLILIGTVDANQVVVSAKISGRVERLAVDEGTPVKRGDLIAELDTAELNAQAQAAGAQLASSRAKVAEMLATERLTKGTTSSDVVNAQAKAQAARSQLNETLALLDRVRSDAARVMALARDGVASQQQKDQSDADLRAAQARVKTAQDTVASADAEVKAAIARTQQQSAAQSTVASSVAQARSAAAQQAEAETRLGYTRVVSPVTGTVSVRVARQGEVVMAGEPIVTIVDYTDTWVRAAVPETDADHIAIGDVFKVRLPSGVETDGKVILKQAEADFATQRDVSRSKRDIKAIGLKLSIANPGGRFTPGMTAEVVIPKSKLESK
ncbi:MAG: efflux RND transporter periplasmic adaptor subunit [Acidobacteriota bacterium]|nr:efflux RND transporter periplasmic adaptor subunit [Acidobacteriota bacterium]